MRESAKPFINAAIFFAVSVGLFIFYDTKRYDNEIAAKCAQDGGPVIFETVGLPLEFFNADGKLILNTKDISSSSAGGGFDSVFGHTDLVGNSNSEMGYGLVMSKQFDKIIRKSDSKVMASFTAYMRRGGDFPLRALLALPPTGYSCPSIKTDLLNAVFHKE